ncbi:MAG: TsoY family (seleno)protein [Halorhodospira sp.]
MLYRMPRNLDGSYSPLYWLAALGAGGLTVSFFLWLMFWVPHPGKPVSEFSAITAAFSEGSLAMKAAIGLAWAGIASFAFMHYRLLLWNVREYRRFLRTEAYRRMRGSRTEIQLLAAPLAVAMAINVAFVVGLVAVPGLWSIVEWLFPFAMAAFLVVGIWALRLLGDYLGRGLTEGHNELVADNSLSQTLPAFTLVMVGVGLSAPAAMSATPATAVVSLLLSSFFMISGVLIGAVMLVLGIRAMLEQSADAVSAPSLWLGVPILTIVGITLVRQTHAFEVHFGTEAGGVQTLGVLGYLLVTQLVFGLLGWVVMRRYRYFQRFVFGPERSPGSYTLVCPGVALAVMIHFFTNVGLAKHGVIEPLGVAYCALSAVAVAVQLATILLVLRLNRKHFRERGSGYQQADTVMSGAVRPSAS